ncbi:MAG: FG-GAP-like repeat-containing protein [candidate division KSB1 bacterium]|nr:FG-GAP-like repeat-containing protein [candidate division KSB1 bacterium]
MKRNQLIPIGLVMAAVMLVRIDISGHQPTKVTSVIFTEVTELAKVSGPWDSGTAFGDFNNDGFQDFYIAYRFGKNALFMNKGDGTFANITHDAWVGFEGWTTGVSWADFNNDGYLDLYICNHNVPNLLYQNRGNGISFADVTTQAGVGCNLNSYFGVWGDYNNDGFVDIYVVNFEVGESNILYQNNGDGTFTDVTNIAGVDGYPQAKSRGVAWGDYNNDGFLDLFVNNQGEDVLYRNNKDGTFTDVTREAGIYDSGNGYGCGWGDYNNDGFLDLFVANRNARGVLFANQGNGTFVNVTSRSGLDIASGIVGCAWGDIDNDRDLDLYVFNAWGGCEYLFLNDGDGKFIEMLATSGIRNYSSANTTSFGDYDNDGDLDLLVTTYQATGTHLYQNNGTNNHWLTVNLVGTVSNRAAIGARVRIVSDGQNQIREVSGGAGYYSQDSLPLEFGLGQAQMVDSLRITWPSGIIWDTTNIAVNQILTIHEGLFAHDVMALRIVSPDNRTVGDTVIPQLLIKNIGQNEERNFLVTCLIDSFGTITYADMQMVEYLASLDTMAVIFVPWFPTRGTEYVIRFTIFLPNDFNPKNNEISKKVVSLYDHDVMILRIISPMNYIDEYERSVIPIASIQNNGRYTQSLFDVTCEIHDSLALVYRGTQTVIKLAPLDTLKIYFGLWEVQGPGPFSIKFFTRLLEDQNRINDTLSMTINLREPPINVISKENTELPREFFLSNTYPNPFNEVTRMEYHVPQASKVSIDIYDVLGRHIKNLVNTDQDPGSRLVIWDARDDQGTQVVSGIYIIRMQAKNFEQIQKVLYLK